MLGYADDTFIMAKAPTMEAAVTKANLHTCKVITKIKNLGLHIAADKTGIVAFNAKNKNNNIYSIYIDRQVVRIDSTVKYLGLILDRKWSFIEHFDYVENKISKVSRALCAIMPNLRRPRERKRRLYAHVIESIINYGAPIWSEATVKLL